MSRKKEKKSEISPHEGNFQKEPVGSSQNYSTGLHLLLQQRICPQDSLSHELHALLITDTLIMLQVLTAKCHPSQTICPQRFQSLYGNKCCMHYKASVLPLCCTSSVQVTARIPVTLSVHSSLVYACKFWSCKAFKLQFKDSWVLSLKQFQKRHTHTHTLLEPGPSVIGLLKRLCLGKKTSTQN